MYNFDIDAYLKTVLLSDIEPKIFSMSFIFPCGNGASIKSLDSEVNLLDMDDLRAAINNVRDEIVEWHKSYERDTHTRILGRGERLALLERELLLLCAAWNELPDIEEPIDSFLIMQEAFADAV